MTKRRGTASLNSAPRRRHGIAALACARSQRRSALWLASAIVTVAIATLVGLPPAIASADVGAKIVRLCTDGKSISGFSVRAYRKALAEMETEVIEYTECPNLISEAENQAAGRGGSHGKSGAPGGPGSSNGGGGNPSGGGSEPQSISSALIPTTPAEQHAIEAAREVEPPEVMLGEGKGEPDVRPGVVHANIASAASSLPTPLLAVLALLIALIAILAGNAVRDRLRRDGQ